MCKYIIYDVKCTFSKTYGKILIGTFVVHTRKSKIQNSKNFTRLLKVTLKNSELFSKYQTNQN